MEYLPPAPESLNAWLSGDACKGLMRHENHAVAESLSHAFGYNLLHVGIGETSVKECPIEHHISLKSSLQDAQMRGGLCAQAEYLPFIQNSLDAVVLQHALDFTRSPHKVLREASRVLMPKGDLIVTGFNPWSLWGVRRFIPLQRKNVPWVANFISIGRIKDWLTLLDFKIDSVSCMAYGLPINTTYQSDRLRQLDDRLSQSQLPGGAIYVIKAKKQYAGMTPIKPVWRVKRRMEGVASPLVREHNKQKS